MSQLVVASDSRVTGGEIWDWCPKVLPLERPSAIVAVAGDMTTAYAYMLQSIWVTHLEQGNKNGRVDFVNYVDQVQRALLTSEGHRDVSGISIGGTPPTAELILAGWSWRHLDFQIWILKTNRNGEQVKLEQTSGSAGVVFVGTGQAEARHRWLEQVRAKKDPTIRRTEAANPQWEPLGILIDMAKDPTIDDIGGVPQVVTANQYGLSESFLIEWPSGESKSELWCGGRPLGQTRSDLRALRFSSDDAGTFTAEPYFPVGLTLRDSEILRNMSQSNEGGSEVQD